MMRVVTKEQRFNRDQAFGAAMRAGTEEKLLEKWHRKPYSCDYSIRRKYKACISR